MSARSTKTRLNPPLLKDIMMAESYKSPLLLTDPRDVVSHVHCVVHRCRWSVW